MIELATKTPTVVTRMGSQSDRRGTMRGLSAALPCGVGPAYQRGSGVLAGRLIGGA
jgi:hypothetical protein